MHYGVMLKMTANHVPDELVVHESEYWSINHRVNSVLPGYFMVGSKIDTNELSVLPKEALYELGSLLGRLQKTLSDLLAPKHFYVGRYGHMAGHSIHFHVIPVCDWVVSAFESDERYKVLRQFYTSGVYEDGSDPTFDGADMTLFIWREFCESRNPPQIHGLSIQNVVKEVRNRFA